MTTVDEANRPRMSVADPVAAPDALTPAWLSEALGAKVSAVTSTSVGTGQMGACFRLVLEGDDDIPRTVVAKLPAAEAATREFLHGSYSTEVTFYRDLFDSVQVSAPCAYYAEISQDPNQRGTFTLLLEDLSPASQGDQISGCTPAQALLAVENVAGLHAPRWSDPTLFDVEGLKPAGPDDAAMMDSLFPDAVETVLEMLGARVAPEDAATLREVSAFGGEWSLAQPDRFSLVHGDYRLDNLMFHDDRRLWAVDWQTLALGLPTRDVALVVSSGLPPADRRRHEVQLVEAYRQRLVKLGVTGYSQEACWEDYRLSLLQTPLIAAFGCAYSSVRTGRGDLMFAAMIARGCQAIRDLDTTTLLKAL